jgi:hypothetical protein
MAVGAFAPVANAEVTASAGVANMYYWRGYDLGNGSGTPAVFGDVGFSEGGFYTGIWGSSGDNTLGTEYDLYIGYGGEAGKFTYDFSLWNYNYPSAMDEDGMEASPEIGDLVEGVVALGYGPVTATYYHGMQDLEDYWYATLEASFGAFSIKYGQHETDVSHIDLSYSYNDNLSFTLGQIVDDADGSVDDDLKFIVSYSMPIE